LGICWGMYAWTLHGSFPFDSPPNSGEARNGRQGGLFPLLPPLAPHFLFYSLRYVKSSRSGRKTHCANEVVVRCEVIFFHWCPWVNVLLRIPRHRAAEPGGRTRLLAPSIARCKMGLTW
jgi:hypothetical protein